MPLPEAQGQEATGGAPGVGDEVVRRLLGRVGRRAEERRRRLQRLENLWAAGDTEESVAVTALGAELRGLGHELRAAGLRNLADALGAAASALGAYRQVRGDDEPLQGGRRILIVDDSVLTREVIALALEGAGYVVSIAATTEEYAVRVQEFEPELLLVEPAHPQLSDGTAWAGLRARIKNPVVPVILFSSAPMDRLAHLASEAGADGFLPKDQGTERLVAHLGEVLSQVLW